MKLQEYINNKYPNKKDKENIRVLGFTGIPNIKPSELTFDGTDWTELETIIFGEKQLKEILKIVNCPKLKTLVCGDNEITRLDLNDIAEKQEHNKPKIELPLERINLTNNKICLIDLPSNLLSSFIKLNVNRNRLNGIQWTKPIAQYLVELNVSDNKGMSIYLAEVEEFVFLESLILNNTFANGNLKYLSELTRLKKLSISNTNIDSGAEYLPNNLEEFYCYPNKKVDFWDRMKAVNLAKELLDLSNLNFEDCDETVNFVPILEAYKTTTNLKKKLKKTKEKVEELETELEIERDTNRESAELMDKFYRQQFPFNSNLDYVRNEMSKQILELNQENRVLKKETKRLQEQLEITEQIAQIEINPKSK